MFLSPHYSLAGDRPKVTLWLKGSVGDIIVKPIFVPLYALKESQFAQAVTAA
jgi:hypothetical protein